MPNIVLPEVLHKFTGLNFQIVGSNRSGGRAMNGGEQVAGNPSGYWIAQVTLQIGAMAWNGSSDLLLYRSIMAQSRGRWGVWELPYPDGRGPAQLESIEVNATFDDSATFSDGSTFDQSSLPVTVTNNAALNAVQMTLTFPTGISPVPGQCFTMPDGHMHMITEIVSVAGNQHTVGFQPWLRTAATVGQSVNFDKPTCLMRLDEDLSGSAEIRSGEIWTRPTLSFSEAFV